VLGPASRLLIALLIAGSAGLLVAGFRLRPTWAKIACGGLAIIVAMAGGVASVNNYYGYYRTWGQLQADLNGGNAGSLGTTAPLRALPSGPGRIAWTALPGRRSGYDRHGLVYLPPQYGQPRYAHVRFPVVELFHGSPGTPLAWDTVLQVNQVADTLLARHLIGPMVLVMPAINGPGRDFQDCVDGPGVRDDTYLTQDVRTDILTRYRVSADPYQWGAAGYSSGGYCAANLALRHRTCFGAAAVMEGYFRAADGPAGTALHGNKALQTANSPLYLAEKLQPDDGPLPAFWVADGTRDGGGYRLSHAFAAALDRIEQVPLVREIGASHTAAAWSAALPAALAWLWQQLAPPNLRVLFPVHTTTGNLTITLPAREAPRPGASHPATRRRYPGWRHVPRKCPPALAGQAASAPAERASARRPGVAR
jgi:enterochelin esterase-like enzyme